MRASACASPGKAEGGTGSPPPRKKKHRGGRWGGRENSPQPPNRPPTPPEAAKPPTQKAPKTGPPKRHRGPPSQNRQHEARNSGPLGKGTPKHADTHHAGKKKEPAAQPERKGMGGQGPQGLVQEQPATDTTKPNHEHHKQPAKEGQHHKPCPNTPTQDPSQDWRG